MRQGKAGYNPQTVDLTILTPLGVDGTLPAKMHTDHEGNQPYRGPLNQKPCGTKRECDHTSHGVTHNPLISASPRYRFGYIAGWSRVMSDRQGLVRLSNFRQHVMCSSPNG